MFLLTRYVLSEILKIFLTALTVVTLVLIFSYLVDELKRSGFGPGQILLILPYLIPYAIKTGMHGAVLLAVCIVYGRLAASNELLAVKSMGISPLIMLWPAVLLALPLSLLGVWLDDVDATWGKYGLQRLLMDSADDVAYGFLRTQRIYQKDPFTIVVKDVQGRKLIYPTLTIGPRGGPDTLSITAQDAELTLHRRENRLSMVLRNGTIHGPNGFEGNFPDTIEQNLPLDAKRGEEFSWRRFARQKALVDSLARKVQDEKQQAGMPALASLAPIADDIERLKGEEHQMIRLQTQFLHKWANSFCCLSFILIGVPVSILLRSADFLTSFFACFLPIVLVYQPLQKLPINLAECGVVSPYCVWIGNVLLGGIGAWLLRKVVRH
jgi:lipopolysaccharide export system permease protein